MRPTTRRTLARSLRHRPPVTRDLRQRQLPTVPLHAVPTGECQIDPPSLLRTLRCSSPRGQPIHRTAPLDVLLHVRTPFRLSCAIGGSKRGSSRGRGRLRECRRGVRSGRAGAGTGAARRLCARRPSADSRARSGASVSGDRQAASKSCSFGPRTLAGVFRWVARRGPSPSGEAFTGEP